MIFNNFIELCHHLYNPVLGHFCYPQKFPFACLSLTFIPTQPQATAIYSLSYEVTFSRNFQERESLSALYLRFIHIGNLFSLKTQFI